MQHFSSVHETATEDVMNLNPGFSGSVHHDCFHYPVIYAMPYYPSFLVDIWGCQGRNVGIFLVPSKVRWFPNSVQFSSIIQLCPTLCDPMDCSTPGLPVLHHLLELAQTLCPLSWLCHPTISSSVVSSSCFQSFPASGSFLMSQLFASDGQSIGASASVLPMKFRIDFL